MSRAKRIEKEKNRLLAKQSEKFIDRLSIQLAKMGEEVQIISPDGLLHSIVLSGHAKKQEALNAIENGCRLRAVLPRLVKF